MRLPAAKIPQIMHVHTDNLFHRLITTDMAINGNAFADTRKKGLQRSQQKQPRATLCELMSSWVYELKATRPGLW